jgi:hypothetical protein
VRLQEKVLKLLEFVVCSLNFVPMAELASVMGVLTGSCTDIVHGSCYLFLNYLPFIKQNKLFALILRP